jgi:YbbR domain-containing protein
MRFLRWLTGSIGLKLLALFFAVFLWLVAVLDRTYEVQIEVPVVVAEKGRAERVITGVDTRTALVTVSGKGKELLRLRSLRLEFRPVVPEGRFGSRQIKLNPADLRLPGNLTVRGVEPEVIEVKLGPAQAREVQVVVPTRGQPGGGMMVSSIRVKTPVRLFGPAADVDAITELATETLDLSSVRNDEVRRLAVQPPAGGFSCEPETVEVEISLAKEGARIFLGLPVRVQAPATLAVQVVPSEAQVAIAGPAERIDSLKPEDITVQIKISSLKPGEYRLGADVVLPEKFRLVKIEPQLFDVIIQ